MNELPNTDDTVNFTLFADDTTVVCSNTNYTELVSEANSLLLKLFNWSINNRLSFNAKKTTCLLITNRNHDIETPSILNVNCNLVPFDDHI